MITIYTGDNLADVLEATGEQTIFENQFATQMGAEYPAMWAQVPADSIIICKTNEAIRCAPSDSMIVRIGRSVRNSDNGALIETREEHGIYMYLADMELTNNHIAQRAP